MRISLFRSLRAASLAGAAVLFVTIPATAQRLPLTVKPLHYSLTLTPDLKAATFSGTDVIDVELTEPMSAITLNAIEIKFGKVTTEVGGKTLIATVSEDAEKQQATLDFGQNLPAGKLKLAIVYTGLLNGELRGFYLSKTAKRNYAVTQFEATDARRAFPSFDEPALKATFSIKLIVDKPDTVISNTNMITDEPVGTDKHAVTFAETPRMSTYLVAFLVGDFQCLSGSSDGVPIRSCATPDQVQYGKFALEAAEFTLHYYDTYFGIKYPMPKLDMIAIPDFEAGAMENFGAITYRETDLLVDPDHASVGALKRVADVVTHEMAHQWFGDMVTLEWWDNTWLNEGFATWMENKPVEAWKPEWNISQDVVQGNQGTLDLDARNVTRTIRAKANTPEEINEMFDGISYGKAGAVLLMVENYLGEETFRQGVHNYLAAHLYGNATAEDFWSAQTATSHKPVDKIMESFVALPGVPLLTFGDAAGGSVPVTQQRFFLNPKAHAESAQSWTVPVCLHAATGGQCELLTPGEAALKAPAGSVFFANASGAGYYRTAYSADVLRDLTAHAQTALSPEERLVLLGDQWALTRAGKSNTGAYLDLAGAVSANANSVTVDVIGGSLRGITTRIASTPEERAALAVWVRAKFGAEYRELGAPAASDSSEKRELRASLMQLLAGTGQDPDVISQAKALTASSMADSSSVESTLADAALGIAAINGDTAFFDQLQKLATTAVNPQMRSRSLHALARFRDSALENRALTYAVSGEVKNQDVVGLLAIELSTRDTQEAAWQFIQANWDKVIAQVTTDSGSGLVGATGSFCSTEKADEIGSFFAMHKVPSSARALARAKDAISDCVDLRAAQEPSLKAWLAKQQ
jgi:aminopeptidase N